MLIVSKKVASNVANRVEELKASSAVRAARGLPGFETSQKILNERALREKQPRQGTADTPASEGPSGGRLTPEAW